MIGVGRLSPNWLLAKICEYYVEVFRNVPLLLWLFLIYKLISESLPGAAPGCQRPRTPSSSAIAGSTSRCRWHTRSTNGWVSACWSASWRHISRRAGRGSARKRPASRSRRSPPASALVVGVPALVWLAGGAPVGTSWPELKGFNFVGGTVIQPEFTALLLGLVLYTSAFVAEIVRSGILALNKGQTEAASALGLSRGQVMRLVLLPQAMRLIIPPMTSQYLNITKDSSLAIAIGYPDLVASVNVTINQTGQAIENVLIIMAAYLSVSLSISAFMNYYNKRIALTER